jgi:hypothetical protein
MTPRSGEVLKDGSISGSYVCSGAKAGLCDGFTVDMEDVDGAVLAYLAEVGIDAEASIRLVAEANAARTAATAAELDSARASLADVDDSLARIKRDYREGKISAEDWQGFKADLEDERKAAAAQVARLEAQTKTNGTEAAQEAIPAVADALALVRHAVEAGEKDALRSALERLFSRFIVGEIAEAVAQPVTADDAEAAAYVRTVREQIAAAERKAGRTVAEANAATLENEARVDIGAEYRNPRNPSIASADSLVILPEPRSEALAAIIENGEPIYLVDETGAPTFRRIAVPTTYNVPLTT